MQTATRQPIQVLLETLADHDVKLDSNDVAWAFESPQTEGAIESWVKENLGPGNLLTREEHQLHTHNTKRNRNETHLDAGRPLNDGDFEAAVLAIEQSTAEIKRQTAMLETQRTALVDLQARNRIQPDTERLRDLRRRDQAKTQLRVQLEVDDQVDNLREQLALAERQSKADSEATSMIIQNVLQHDDQVLDNLQTFLRTLSHNVELMSTGEIDKLCSRLATLRSQTMLNRINNLYQNAITSNVAESHTKSTALRPESNQEAGALEEELDSLITEVGSVLQLVIEDEHRGAIVKSIQDSRSQADQRELEFMSHATSTLKYMINCLRLSSSYAQDLQASNRALNLVSHAFTSATTTSTQPITRPPAPRSTSSKSNHLTSVPSISIPEAISALLRQHNIRLPERSKASVPKIIQVLTEAVAERKLHLSAMSMSTDQTIPRQLTDALGTVDKDLESLDGLLHAYSPFGSVHLADPYHEQRLAELDRDVAKAGRDMAELDVGEIVNRLRDSCGKMM